MFQWRRKKDGFEWHEYVRTTILMRRARRREKIDQAREAAVKGVRGAGSAAAEGLNKAGHAAAEGLNVAGHAAAAGLKKAGHKGRVAGAAGLGSAAAVSARLASWGVATLRSGAAFAAAAPGNAWRWTRPRANRLGSGLAELLAPFAELLAQPKPSLVAGATSIAAAIGAVARFYSRGADTTFAAATALAIFGAFALLLPRIVAASGGDDYPSPNLARDRQRRAAAVPVGEPLNFRRMAGWGTFAAVAVLGLGRLLDPASVPDIAPKIEAAKAKRAAPAVAPPPSSDDHVLGRAVALSGDTLRIGSRRIKLAEIEAPERSQTCVTSANKRWRCGEDATSALAKLVRRRSVACEIGGETRAGTANGRCRIGDDDIAETLVREGHVFAVTGFFASYSATENEAKAAGRGVWSGAADRPADFRAARWEAARKAAPDGCPIKGQVSRSKRTYVLPWAVDYERVEVRETRGGRWFCSEDEALSAGWQPSETS